jgi:Alr-MurF fusion protein
MVSYAINEIAIILKGELTKSSGGKVSYLLIDSRKVLFPRESLFFALKGQRNDGHQFIHELYLKGVRNFVVSQVSVNSGNFPRANFIVVKDTLTALHQLVAWHRQTLQLPVVGITGSNGKTIIKEWTHQCLSPDQYVIRNPKSFNSQVGVPLSVWLLQPEANLGIFEAGISRPGEMQALKDIIKPTIGIFTNIGDAHQEHFSSIEQKINEKLKLFSETDVLIYCSDHQQVSRQIELKPGFKPRLFSWGNSAKAIVHLKKVEYHSSFSVLSVSWQQNSFEIQIPFVDKASVENAMHVCSLMLVLGYNPETIAERMVQLENVAMRLELKEGINNCSIINDYYNSDLESLHIALDYLGYQNQHPQKVLVLSDIAQSGYPREVLYQRVAVMVKQKNIDRLIGIGPDIKRYGDFFELRKDFFETTNKFMAEYDFAKFHNMAILLKGARSFEFEQISKILQKQSHRTIMNIDLSAMEYNLNYFKALLKPTTGIIAMVKAFSYGSGTHEIANLCQYQRVAMLAVAFADEGIELRNNGIRIPIIVLNPEEENFANMIEHQLEPEIYNFDSLKAFNNVVVRSGTGPYPIHVKLDTGMHRSGFLPFETNDLITEIKSATGLKIKTIFSHLSSADEPAQDDFTFEQIHTFELVSQKIMQQFDYPIKRHILNSAGTERFSKHQFDMVRVGIGLYGISAVDAPLAQVGTLTSSIAQVKKLKSGSSVGYNRKGKVTVDSEIATVPIGYADGLRRYLGNGRGKFWYKGKLVPIIGNVCMDMCMIDVTGLNAREGDEVEIFGRNLPIAQLSEWMVTIPYEVLTGISRRVKRTYQYD